MMEEDYRELYGDLCVQHLTFGSVLTNAELERKILHFGETFGTGILGYSGSGRKYKVYTSNMFLKFLKTLHNGMTLTFREDGEHCTVTDCTPRFVGQNLCIEANYRGKVEMWGLDCFIPE